MREIAGRLRAWNDAGTAYAVATVVSVGGSAPRRPGAAMAVASDGEVVGSVSGGCVEGAVYELCREALRTGEPARESFGYSDDDAFAVGLTCGGTIEVAVRPGPVPDAPLDAIAGGEPVAFVQALDGSGAAFTVRPGGFQGGTGRADLDRVVVGEARALLDTGRTGLVSVACDEDLEVFVQSFAPAPRLLVFGAIDHAAALARIGGFLGYRVTVCDARPVFATPARFPDADEVVADWPHRYLGGQAERGLLDGRTVVCVLTHDARFDVPLLEVALRLPMAYVGAMGSRRTHRERNARLRAAGLTEDELARLRSPIGLDLGARTPEETALSIAAEFVALRRGGTSAPLSRTRGPIHSVLPPDLAPAPMPLS
ncbi:XdhC family protein [Spirillospora sp. CA-294931]|uniref:XdhC family protein n=1 Tax=Spirillospora sp. CA-294931 TaxID=3240042 RepID=UPI003D8AD13A